MAGKAPKYGSRSDVVDAANVFYLKADEACEAMDFGRGVEEARRAMELLDMIEGYDPTKNRCRYLLALCLERQGCVDEAELLYTQNWEDTCKEHKRTSLTSIRVMGTIIDLNRCSLRHDRTVTLITEFLDTYGDELEDEGMGILLIELSYAQSDLGLHQEAFDSIQNAIEVLKRTDSVELLEAYDLHAALHQERSSPSTALQIVEKAFEVSKEMGIESMTLKKRLGFIQFDMGMFAKALEIHEEALADHLINLGEDSIVTLRCRLNCSELYAHLGNYTDAEEQAVEALDVTRKAHKEDLEEVDSALANAAYFFLRTSQYDRALPLFEEDYTICESAYGYKHEDTSGAQVRLGEVLSHIGKFEEGERMMREALANLVEGSGQEHHITFDAQETLASHLMLCGRPMEARDLLLRSIESCKKGTRPENPEALTRDCTLVCVLAELGELAQATSLAKATLDTMKNELDSSAPAVGTAYRALATAYVAEGSAELAMEATAAAEEVTVGNFKDYENYHGSVEEIELYMLYAACHCLNAAYNEALARLDQADTMVERVFSGVCGAGSHFDHLKIQYLRGEILLKMGRHEDGVQELFEAVEGLELCFGTARPHWCHGAALAELAKAYVAIGQHADAIRAGKRAKTILADALGSQHWRTLSLA